MDVIKMLADLQEERRGPGRPAAWMANAGIKRRGRPPGSKNKSKELAGGAGTD
jgi:hypothetical protein